MEKLSLILVSIVVSVAAMPQQPPSYNKKFLDSLLHQSPGIGTITPAPGFKLFSFPEKTPLIVEPDDFAKRNAGAAMISKTNRGTIYNMPLDNIAVLVPDMKQLENMPVSRSALPSNIPNPLYQDRKKK